MTRDALERTETLVGRILHDLARPTATPEDAPMVIRRGDLQLLAHTTHELLREGVRPGDRIRLSVALLRDLYDRPDHESATVELVRAQRTADPATVLVLRVPEATS